MRSSLLHPDLDAGPELPKIKCAFHNDQLLTNFCRCKGCLLPLCPSCIKIHVNEHINLKTNPQLQNINDLIRQLHGKLETYGEKFNSLYKQLVEAEFHVEEFRQKLKGKIYQVKQDLISAIQDHFKCIEVGALQKINELKYVKNMYKCKQYAKKTILSLKNSERNFFSEESKIMRMMIKFEANGVKKQLDNFYEDSSKFLIQGSTNCLSFHIRDNIAQLAIDNLHHFFKIDFQEPNTMFQPKDITQYVKQLYEKPCQKRQIKKSLYKFLSNKNTPNKQHSAQSQIQIPRNYQCVADEKIKDFAQLISSKQAMSFSQARSDLQQISQNQAAIFKNSSSINELNNAETYSSVKQSIVKATQDLNLTLIKNTRKEQQPEPVAQRRRSLSKNKGITLMQSNTTIIDFKKNNQSYKSFYSPQIDLHYINGGTEQFPRNYR